MKQPKIELWYERKEPTKQIEILKFIALNGHKSKTVLTKELDSKITTIDTVVSKMEDAEHGLLVRAGRKTVTENKAQHIFFSLTDKSIKILIENHYEKNDDGISNEPYLSPKEFLYFLERYNDDYPDCETKPKELFTSYIKANPKYKLVLAKEYQKYSSKLEKLVKQFKEASDKVNRVEEDMIATLYESFSMEFNKK